jgi:hypothetical protein
MKEILDITHVWGKKDRNELLKIIKKYISNVKIDEFEKLHETIPISMLKLKKKRSNTLFLTFWKFNPSISFFFKKS